MQNPRMLCFGLNMLNPWILSFETCRIKHLLLIRFQHIYDNAGKQPMQM